MPHRATYFFPRQFPIDGRGTSGFDATSSAKQLLNHENNKTVQKESVTPPSKNEPKSKSTSESKPDKYTAVSELFTGEDNKFVSKKQQFAAFCDWLAEKKVEKIKTPTRLSSDDDERELLLPPVQAPAPEPAVATETVKDSTLDGNFDRQVSLPRLSSGSSYAGSLFSSTTLDGNFSSEVNKESSTRASSSTVRQQEEEEESKDSLVQKAKEGYFLQLTLARRLTSQANLAVEPLIMVENATDLGSDSQTASYRLWVCACSPFTLNMKCIRFLDLLVLKFAA